MVLITVLVAFRRRLGGPKRRKSPEIVVSIR